MFWFWEEEEGGGMSNSPAVSFKFVYLRNGQRPDIYPLSYLYMSPCISILIYLNLYSYLYLPSEGGQGGDGMGWVAAP